MAGSGSRFVIAGWMVAASWALTVVIFYFALGGWLGAAVEGQDRSLLPSWPLWLSALLLLDSLIVTVLWSRRLGGAAQPDSEPVKGLGRRRFLAGFAVSLGGILASLAATFGKNIGWLTVTAPNIQAQVPNRADTPRAAWEGARVQRYQRLGRTNFEVSDIALG